MSRTVRLSQVIFFTVSCTCISQWLFTFLIHKLQCLYPNPLVDIVVKPRLQLSAASFLLDILRWIGTVDLLEDSSSSTNWLRVWYSDDSQPEQKTDWQTHPPLFLHVLIIARLWCGRLHFLCRLIPFLHNGNPLFLVEHFTFYWSRSSVFVEIATFPYRLFSFYREPIIFMAIFTFYANDFTFMLTGMPEFFVALFAFLPAFTGTPSYVGSWWQLSNRTLIARQISDIRGSFTYWVPVFAELSDIHTVYFQLTLFQVFQSTAF